MPPITIDPSVPVEGKALQDHIEAALATPLMSDRELQLLYQVVRRLFRPVVVHADRVPTQPCLFVGNHSLFALDGLVIAPMFWRELGRKVRGLGDRFLFSNPLLSALAMRCGAVLGHPEVCENLMSTGADLLVFPGGAHEAVKPATDLYELQWKERYGFVRLAARMGYTIVPFGIVGPDEFYAHLLESEELRVSLPGRVLTRLGLIGSDTRADIIPPIPRGALGTLLPRPKRCFLGFGEAIDLSLYAGRVPTRVQQRKIRDQVAGAIEEQLAALLRLREQYRREDSLLRRILNL